MAEHSTLVSGPGLYPMAEVFVDERYTPEYAANLREAIEARKERLAREALGGAPEDPGIVSHLGMIAIVLVTATALLGIAPREAREVILASSAATGR